MDEAGGAHVALLTQDAEPADERWLERLLEGFDARADVGIVYGPYLPRPDASPAVRMELERWFRSLSPDGAPAGGALGRARARRCPCSQLIGARGASSPTPTPASPARPGERVPFREVPYAEDRRARDRHAARRLRQGVRARRGRPALPCVLRARESCAAASTSGAACARSTAGASRLARAPLAPAAGRAGAGAARARSRRGASASERRATLAAVSRHHVVRLAGALLGSRADRLPAAARAQAVAGGALPASRRSTSTHTRSPTPRTVNRRPPR